MRDLLGPGATMEVDELVLDGRLDFVKLLVACNSHSQRFSLVHLDASRLPHSRGLV